MPEPYLIGWKKSLKALLKVITERHKRRRKILWKAWKKKMSSKFYWKTIKEIIEENEKCWKTLRTKNNFVENPRKYLYELRGNHYED